MAAGLRLFATPPWPGQSVLKAQLCSRTESKDGSAKDIGCRVEYV